MEARQTQLASLADFCCLWEGGKSSVRFVAGADVSVLKENEKFGVASFVVWDNYDKKVASNFSCELRNTKKYEPGFLGFREAPVFLKLFERMKEELDEEFWPKVVLLDGNGYLHPRHCGLATHFGVLSGLPSIGVAKTLYEIDGLTSKDIRDRRDSLVNAGDSFALKGRSGNVWGAALKTSKEAKNPIFVSIGHKIDLQNAIEIVRNCSSFRVPEPIRQADILSRLKLQAFI